MAAVLLPALPPHPLHRLQLPAPRQAADLLAEVRYGLGACMLRGALLLEAGDWPLGVSDLQALQDLLARQQLWMARVSSRRPETLVAAAALGLEAEADSMGELVGESAPPGGGFSQPQPDTLGRSGSTDGAELTIHRGTLRSGDHLRVEGSVLLLGDLNPGARISAAGHVLVWGRLRGVAHAGLHGDRSARIVALQLRPLQLRIADAVARGPEEAPATGQAEQASLVDGRIRIDPASPSWPLSG